MKGRRLLLGKIKSIVNMWKLRHLQDVHPSTRCKAPRVWRTGQVRQAQDCYMVGFVVAPGTGGVDKGEKGEQENTNDRQGERGLKQTKDK